MSETFLIPRRTEREMIKMFIDVHVKFNERPSGVQNFSFSKIVAFVR
jgi:hypothetical protein